MIVAGSLQERDAVPDAVVSSSNGDGTWNVYQIGDAIPESIAWAVASPEPQE